VGIVVIISSRSPANDELIAVSSQLAGSRCSDLMLLGVADIAPWIRSLAPLGGSVCLRTVFGDTQTEIEEELRRCIEVVPSNVAARYACCGGWDDPKLIQLLRLEEGCTIVAQLSNPMSRQRRKLRAIARYTDGVLMMSPFAHESTSGHLGTATATDFAESH
jgi:hypothetical protein